jgi:hypothetical protein
MDFLKKSIANLSAAANSVATDDPFVGKSVAINEKTALVRKKLAEGGYLDRQDNGGMEKERKKERKSEKIK